MNRCWSPTRSRVKSHDAPLHSDDGTACLPIEVAGLLESQVKVLGAVQVTVVKHGPGSSLPGSHLGSHTYLLSTVRQKT